MLSSECLGAVLLGVVFSPSIFNPSKHKECPCYRRSLQPSKGNIQPFKKTWKLLTFFIFCPLGSGSGSTDLTESGSDPDLKRCCKASCTYSKRARKWTDLTAVEHLSAAPHPPQRPSQNQICNGENIRIIWNGRNMKGYRNLQRNRWGEKLLCNGTDDK